MAKLKEAARLTKEMVLMNIYPNVYIFNILVDALCKEVQVNEARGLIGTMMKKTSRT